MSIKLFVKETLKRSIYYAYIGFRLLQRTLKGEVKYRLPMKTTNNGKVLHILMNGPSLDESIGFVSKKKGDVMVANYAIKLQRILDLKPRYLCLLDPEFADDEEYLRLVHFIEKENHEFEIFMPNVVYNKYVSLYGCSAARQINNISIMKTYDTRFDKKLYEKNLEMPVASTVAVAALYVGIQLGYKTIYLHGNDFSWMKNLDTTEDGKIINRDEHFYGITEDELKMSMLYYSGAFYTGFIGFNNIATYAKDEGVNIINMSLKSYIDVFEKYKEDTV